MSEERKAICPYCGKPMTAKVLNRTVKYEEIQFTAQCQCECGGRTPIAKGPTYVSAVEAAYDASTHRPENKPLTIEQIMAMDDMDAVWLIFDDNEEVSNKIALDGAFGWKIKLADIPFPTDPLYFAARPTPADIEAARAARRENEYD